MDLEAIREQARAAVEELLEAMPEIQEGQLLVIGCSTSEVRGNAIGSSGAPEVAEAILAGVLPVIREKGVSLAVQCCEHLNRALVVSRALVQSAGLEEVHAIPQSNAGGSLAAAYYRLLDEPCLVESVRAHMGLDIGDTLIGMHLRTVAVPVRLNNNAIGSARVIAAYARPRLIGGARAVYCL